MASPPNPLISKFTVASESGVHWLRFCSSCFLGCSERAGKLIREQERVDAEIRLNKIVKELEERRLGKQLQKKLVEPYWNLYVIIFARKLIKT